MTDNTNHTFDNPFIGGKNLLFPASLKWLGRLTLKQLKQKHSNTDVDFSKAEALLESLLSRRTANPETKQHPTHAYCPGLTARPVWESKDHPLLAKFQGVLSDNFDNIKQEYQHANNQGIHPQTIMTGKDYLQADTWQNIQLGAVGRYTDKMKSLFPKTIALLEPFGKRIFSAEFIVMKADTTLPPHTDSTNAILAGHLGLDVPENCGVQVNDHLIDFHERDLIFFDQSFAHSAWNKGDHTRVNLLLTFFHPEISDRETDLIFEFVERWQKRALLLSPVIAIEYLFLRAISFFKK